MNKNHPLAYITRKRKWKEIDIDKAFDMICFQCYIDGQFDGKIQVDETREVFEILKKAIKNI